ncbi:hypothetical protein ACP70R_018662 [Stipagrostis hirtigluma subsp. patula]
MWRRAHGRGVDAAAVLPLSAPLVASRGLDYLRRRVAPAAAHQVFDAFSTRNTKCLWPCHK